MLTKELIKELEKRSPNTEVRVLFEINIVDAFNKQKKNVCDTNFLGIEPSLPCAKLRANATLQVHMDIGVVETELTVLNNLGR